MTKYCLSFGGFNIGHYSSLTTIYGHTIYYYNLQQGSDMHLKENIQPCPSVLSKIRDINTYTYNYKEEYLQRIAPEQREIPQKLEYGFLAQELQDIFPEFVGSMDDTILTIRY